LVADDSEGVRKVIADICRREGHSVTAVADGDAALHACFQTSYALVITDQQMPRMTGSALIAALRALRYRAKLCIISGGFADVDHARAASGADIALIKPIDVEQLTAVIRTLTDPAPSPNSI
jgi:CheY-like chemotaxis protein